MTLAQRALERLDAWPDLTVGPASCGKGRALSTPHSEIVHFHSDREADLHLTTGVIRRFSDDLAESTAVRILPGSRWVTVRLDCDTDVDLLLSLVSAALHAHQTSRPSAPQPPVACNLHRVMLLPRDLDPNGFSR
ncbi:luciferase family protein [Streptomyces sp. NPDC001848]|uniref:luciferase domain-containing protein n=1 Tax=Streptomyces sp. NPDC001848 TaxID=3364618 RepID=UPI00368B7B44